MNMLSFEGQTALVTGASRGIGRTLAIGLAQRGMNVVLSARDAARLEDVAVEIRKLGGSAIPAPADISTEAGVQALFDAVHRHTERLDVCINNAAVGLYGPVAELRSEDLDRMFATNVRGTLLCCREALHMMLPEKRGTIINISSVVGIKGYPNQAGYTASKHAVMGLTKSLAVEAQPHGIRVSAILPGGVATDMVRRSRPDLDPEVLLQPDDILQAVLYLLSLSDRAAVDQLVIRRRASNPF